MTLRCEACNAEGAERATEDHNGFYDYLCPRCDRCAACRQRHGGLDVTEYDRDECAECRREYDEMIARARAGGL